MSKNTELLTASLTSAQWHLIRTTLLKAEDAAMDRASDARTSHDQRFFIRQAEALKGVEMALMTSLED